MKTNDIIVIVSPDDSSSVYNFQQCVVGSCELFENIPDFANIFESYASVECYFPQNSDSNLKVRILTRLSRGRIGNIGRILKCNIMRVLEIMEFDQQQPQSEELALANQLIWLSSNHAANSSEDFHPMTTTTTAGKIQLLKSGPIKSMKITVITSTWPKTHGQTTFLDGVIKRLFQAYDIRVKSKTLIDLRNCPLAQPSFKWTNEVVPDFIFVNECQMKSTDSLIGRVNSQTQVCVEKIHHIEYYTRLAESLQNPDDFDFVGGENVYEKLNQIVQHQSKYLGTKNREETISISISGSLLIGGPSGSGKTRTVIEAAKALRVILLVFKIATSKISNSGSAASQRSKIRPTSKFSKPGAMNQIFEKGVQSGFMYPTILLIEGLELLHIPTSQGDTNAKSSVGKSQGTKQKSKLVSQLCHLLDWILQNCALTVVATTAKAHLIPPSLRIFPRFQLEIPINIPSELMRLKILTSLTKKIPAFATADLNSIAARTPGFVTSDLLLLTHRAHQKMRDQKCDSISESHVKHALSHVFPSALHGTVGLVDVHRAASLDQIAGLDSVKLDLTKCIIWPDSFLRMGIQPSKGPPGCGKTTLVRALAASYHTNFLSASAAGLFSSGVGDSERIVAHLFHRARMAAPCILFLDELDAIVGARASDTRGKTRSVNDSILSMLLTEMDGVGFSPGTTSKSSTLDLQGDVLGPQVIVVGATNRPELIDEALLRPGRFDRIVAVPPPDKAGRLEFLQKSAKKTPMADDVDIIKLAEGTEGYSGSDLEKLVREAALLALTEDLNRTSVSMKHYAKAHSQMIPSISSHTLRSFQENSPTTGTDTDSFLALFRSFRIN